MEQSGNGKVAVITGATGGIGAGVARLLSAAGYSLVLTAPTKTKLDSLASTLKSPPLLLAGDMRDESLPGRLLAATLKAFGRCDVCLNNGGLLEVGPIESIDVDRVCEMVRVNVEGTFRMAYVFLQHFLVQGNGHLINSSSVLGKKVRPTAGAYAATKYAIEALSEALRMELSKTNVQVSCIQPGLVRTGPHANWPVQPAEMLGIDEPLEPDDIARMVLFLLEQPAHVRIPQMMILPKGHEI